MKRHIIALSLFCVTLCAGPVIQFTYVDSMREGYKYIKRYNLELVKVDTMMSAANRKYFIFFYKYREDKDK